MVLGERESLSRAWRTMSSAVAGGIGMAMAGAGVGIGVSFSVERMTSDSTEKLTEESGESIGMKSEC